MKGPEGSRQAEKPFRINELELKFDFVSYPLLMHDFGSCCSAMGMLCKQIARLCKTRNNVDERYPTYGLATNTHSSIMGIKLLCEGSFFSMSYIHVTQPVSFWNRIISQLRVHSDQCRDGLANALRDGGQTRPRATIVEPPSRLAGGHDTSWSPGRWRHLSRIRPWEHPLRES